MKLIEKLSADRLEARKKSEKVRASLLGTIIAEACKQTKEPSDESVYSTLNKFKNSSEEMLKHVQSEQAKEELNIICSYIPTPLTETALTKIVRDLAQEENIDLSLKSMKIFKERLNDLYPGRVQGQLLSQILKNI